jgi:hypothetical protein
MREVMSMSSRHLPGLSIVDRLADRKRPACGVLRRGVHHQQSWLLTGVLLEDSRRRLCDGIRDHQYRTGWTVLHLRPRSPARVLSVISLATPF